MSEVRQKSNGRLLVAPVVSACSADTSRIYPWLLTGDRVEPLPTTEWRSATLNVGVADFPSVTQSPVLSLSFDRDVAVIGDIHGSDDLLRRLLAALPPGIPILVAGDVADRGPNTRGCIEILLERHAQGVRGNHEEWLRAWVAGEGFDSAALSPMMGGRATLKSYGVEGRTAVEIEGERLRVPKEHREWLAGLPVACDLVVCGRRYWVVHAGVPAGAAEGRRPADIVPELARTQPGSLLWPATAPQDVPSLDRPVIMGHVPRAAPIDTGRVIAIDTGAGSRPGGALTAVLLPSRKFVSVR